MMNAKNELFPYILIIFYLIIYHKLNDDDYDDDDDRFISKRIDLDIENYSQ